MEGLLVDDLFGINQIYVEKFFSERLHNAVRDGDIDLVEELLEEPGADINTKYYGENLLWTAIMNRQEEMAIFLIDNGIDITFKCCRIDLQEDDSPGSMRHSIENNVVEVKLNVPTATHKTATGMSSKGSTTSSDETTALADVFVVSCRQLAYEKEMFNIVNLIDFKQGCLLKWLKPPSHNIRLIKSARLAKEASIEPALPPDRLKPPPKVVGQKRSRRHKVTSAATSAPTAYTDPEESSQAALPLPLSSSMTQGTRSVYESESVILPKGSLFDTDKSRGRCIKSCASSQQYLSPNFHMTKTAVVRQRKNNLSIKDQQYRLRHPESCDATLMRPSTHQQNYYDRRPVTSEQCTSRVLHRQPKTGHSSYANHLPFRRKPVHFEGYVEQMFKRSVHSYQHSARSNPQSKFIGRL